MKSESRRVIPCKGSSKARGWGRAGPRKTFAFDYLTLAKLFDVDRELVRYWVKMGKFDPIDLKSIIDFYNLHNKKE